MVGGSGTLPRPPCNDRREGVQVLKDVFQVRPREIRDLGGGGIQPPQRLDLQHRFFHQLDQAGWGMSPRKTIVLRTMLFIRIEAVAAPSAAWGVIPPPPLFTEPPEAMPVHHPPSEGPRQARRRRPFGTQRRPSASTAGRLPACRSHRGGIRRRSPSPHRRRIPGAGRSVPLRSTTAHSGSRGDHILICLRWPPSDPSAALM